jgi:hypothetical protein
MFIVFLIIVSQPMSRLAKSDPSYAKINSIVFQTDPLPIEKKYFGSVKSNHRL